MRPTVSQAHRTISMRVKPAVRLRGFVTLALLASVSLLTACEPAEPKKPLRPQVEGSANFAAEAAAFEWPEEPSHVVALEIAGRGTIRLGLYEQVAPITVAHFVECVVRGVYEDTLFHRVIEDFMIQGGDPATRKRGPGTTRGNWGDLRVEDEISSIHHTRGVVSLANRGRPNTGEAQFFIVQRDSPHLDGKHAIFGRVLSGMELVDEIASVETDKHGRWGDKDKPLENIILERAVLERGSLAKSDGNPDAEAPAEPDEAESGAPDPA